MRRLPIGPNRPRRSVADPEDLRGSLVTASDSAAGRISHPLRARICRKAGRAAVIGVTQVSAVAPGLRRRTQWARRISQCLGSGSVPLGGNAAKREPSCRSAAAAAARRAQPLGVDVDDKRGQEDEPADENLEEAVDLHIVEAVVEHAKHEQADDRVPDAAASAE
jgi:hypothetical protein